jgi:hypothetical protein
MLMRLGAARANAPAAWRLIDIKLPLKGSGLIFGPANRVGHHDAATQAMNDRSECVGGSRSRTSSTSLRARRPFLPGWFSVARSARPEK